MNQETFEQVPIARDLVTGVDFMKESDIVEVVSDADTETILFAEMPVKTNLRVTHSEPGVKGDTATNATKPATMETGVEIRVPLFINEGDLVQVDTRDGSYLSRVKESGKHNNTTPPAHPGAAGASLRATAGRRAAQEWNGGVS